MADGFISQKVLEEAVLYKLFVYSQNEEEGLEVGNVRSLFEIPISAKRVEMALKELARIGLVDISAGSQYVEDTYSITRKGYMKVEDDLTKPDSTITNIFTQGDEWLTVIIVTAGVPASDRIVSRSDNEAAFARIEKDLIELSSEVEKSNSIEEETGDPKQVVIGELSASKAMVGVGQFHLRRLIGLLLPLLRKLSEKFAGATIGALAGQLIVELSKLI